MDGILERIQRRIDAAEGRGNDEAVKRLRARYDKFAALSEEDRKTAVGSFIQKHGEDVLDELLDVGKSLPVVSPVFVLLDVLIPD